MSTEHRNLPSDVLDLATEALRRESVSAGPKPELVAATVAAVTLAEGKSEMELCTRAPAVVGSDEVISGKASTERKAHMFRIIRWSGLAAAAALVIGAISLRGVWERGGSEAFAQVVANVKKATSVSLECHYRRHSKTGEQSSNSLKVYLQGDFLRLDISEDSFDPNDQPDKVLVADLKKRTALEIDYGPKTYKTFELNDDLMKSLGKPMELLTRQGDKNAELNDRQAQLIGDETLDGRTIHVYRLLPGEFKLQEWKIGKDDVAKVWVDAERNLPVKIEGDFSELSDEKDIHALYDHFQWNKAFNSETFELKPPEGFKKD